MLNFACDVLISPHLAATSRVRKKGSAMEPGWAAVNALLFTPHGHSSASTSYGDFVRLSKGTEAGFGPFISPGGHRERLPYQWVAGLILPTFLKCNRMSSRILSHWYSERPT